MTIDPVDEDKNPVPDKEYYRALLHYYNEQQVPDGIALEIFGFKLSDGSYRFSEVNFLNIGSDLGLESFSSERLLVIVSFAYLEDQIRLMLEKFLVNEDTSADMLDPNKNGAVSALASMANLAFSLGLVSREWLNIIKQMARLRNKFAHVPAVRNFDDLILNDPKTRGVMDNLARHFQLISGDAEAAKRPFRELYWKLFMLMYQLTQFAIDHVVVPQRRRPFMINEIEPMGIIAGFTREDIQNYLDDKWQTFSDEE